MNNNLIKIKYILGSYKEDLNFPTEEDFYYLINNWFYNEGGKSFIHEYRGLEETGKPIFPENILIEKISNEKLTKKLIASLISLNKIKIIKETRFTTYYTIL